MSVVGQSQNGSGKTLSYLIPCIQALDVKVPGKDEFGNPSPQIIIVGDTKALLLQVHKILRDLLDNYEGYTKITTDYLFAGKTIEKDVNILLSTLHQIKTLYLKKQLNLERVKLLVIDEADHVVATDLGKNTAKLLVSKYLKKEQYKFIMTSATMTEDFKQVLASIKSDKNFTIFELPREQLTLKNVYQFNIKYSTREQKEEVI